MKYQDYVVIDLETSIKNRGEDAIGTLKASPFHPDNEIVMAGLKWTNGPKVYIDSSPLRKAHIELSSLGIIVGQNIKFDLLYNLKYHTKEWKEALIESKIWDTMLVEYLLTGQQSKFMSLDKLATKYGGTLKDDKIKEYWKNDIDTEDIPQEELKEYLEQDLLNTELVFKEQYEQAVNMDMLPLIETQMEALKATIEMEFNGMHFDIQRAQVITDEVREDYHVLKTVLETEMATAGIEFPNASSPEQISLFLFGGDYKYKADAVQRDAEGNVINYKTGLRKGQPKTKKIVVGKVIDPLYGTSLTKEGAKKGIYSTADDVLKQYNGTIIDKILKFRNLSKDLNTYWLGVVREYWPNDGCIHGQLNHCNTNTGRLSSSKPNMQNISGK